MDLYRPHIYCMHTCTNKHTLPFNCSVCLFVAVEFLTLPSSLPNLSLSDLCLNLNKAVLRMVLMKVKSLFAKES